MQSRVSLTGVLAAILMFCITVAMHEATRADDLALNAYVDQFERKDRRPRPRRCAASRREDQPECCEKQSECRHAASSIAADCDRDCALPSARRRFDLKLRPEQSHRHK